MTSETLYNLVDDLFLAFRGFERFEELGIISADGSAARFGWGNWLETPIPELLRGVTAMSDDDYTVDYEEGIVSFVNPFVAGEEVRATYTMRLYPKEIYGSFVPTALSYINLRKPQTSITLDTLPDSWIGPLILSIYNQTCRMLLPKMSMFKWRRLFESPDGIIGILQQGIAESTAQLTEQLATIKRRGMIVPAAVTTFNMGRQGVWQYDEINFQSLVVAR